MKFLDKKFNMLSAAIALMIVGSMVGAVAQNQAHQEIDYENMFENVEATEDHDVLSLLKQDENFSIFVDLIEQSGLELGTALDSAAELTVFAPTNEAFEELTVEQYKQLTEPEDLAFVQRVVEAHIMTEKVYLSNFEGNQVIGTSDGQEIAVTTTGGQGAIGAPGAVSIGGAGIVKSDVEASNGVIHVMDAVILPEQTGNVTGFGPR